MRSSFVERAEQVLRRFAPSEDGAALVEFALAVPILVMLAIGAFDFGMAFQQKHHLAAAAQAGAQMAVQERSLNEVDLADVDARVQQEAGTTGNPLTVASRYYCACPEGGNDDWDCSTSPTPCAAGTGRPPLQYIEVDVQRQVDLVFSYPGVAETIPLRATATMRVN